MRVQNTIFQKSKPRIEFFDMDKSVINATLVFDLASSNATNLLSFNFALQKNDPSGSFAITFHPMDNLYSKIKKMQLVKFYENDKLVFMGIVHSKKYSASMGGSGVNRTFTVSGTCITGLLSQLIISTDTTALTLVKNLKITDALNKKLTLDNLGSDRTVKSVLDNVFDYFKTISENWVGTPKIFEFLEKLYTDSKSIYEVDNSTFAYPLGCVMNGNQTQDFFSLIDSVVPTPLYEKIPYMEDKNIVKIRKIPFAPNDWKGLTMHDIDLKKLLSFDLSESDNEVYTVFHTYLNGSPIDEQKQLILASQTGDSSFAGNLTTDDEKFKTYGYRPLFVHYLGYTKTEKDNTDSKQLQTETETLRDCFSKVDEMLKGSITLAMTYSPNDSDFIQVGDKVKFLGLEFYVEGISHSWSYLSGGQISLTITRGGNYDSEGKFSQATDVDKLIHLVNKGQSK